jgi:PleD family two-component response regulator
MGEYIPALCVLVVGQTNLRLSPNFRVDARSFLEKRGTALPPHYRPTRRGPGAELFMTSDDTNRNARLPANYYQGQSAQMSVLFIEPDKSYAERLSRTLSNVSAVAIVPTAHAALNAISLHVPSLIVTEIDLPDANGLELIAKVHSTPAMRHVLLMVVTNRSGVRDKINAFQAGADDYLVKPLDPTLFALRVQLLSRFRKVIGNSPAQF